MWSVLVSSHIVHLSVRRSELACHGLEVAGYAMCWSVVVLRNALYGYSSLLSSISVDSFRGLLRFDVDTWGEDSISAYGRKGGCGCVQPYQGARHVRDQIFCQTGTTRYGRYWDMCLSVWD
ncbi:hypothetical protein BU16DRAFT_393239 [Lophium mytilinum]|uniref:Uncharacterized protein n=1 Tax=Lophium mytilinum TaxID=390894 RepID=A0A6A6QSS4_9PEZI|nr:hypothetical protein BU16DRAFT_393239 [Lophium mytilinum]